MGRGEESRGDERRGEERRGEERRGEERRGEERRGEVRRGEERRGERKSFNSYRLLISILLCTNERSRHLCVTNHGFFSKVANHL
jgi:hypothetical protein